VASNIDDVQRLVFAVIHHDDADPAGQALVAAGYRATRIDSQGGFLRRGNAVFMVGVGIEQVDDVIATLRSVSTHASGQSGSGSAYGIVFVVPVDAFDRL
tara:strand:+ start:3594 stop:3893 length:300 start_codon:yes stop_codon:yes gene_type:complete